MFLLVSLSKPKFFTRVALVSILRHSCRTRVARVALVLHLYRTRVACVWHSCCKLDQILLEYEDAGTCSFLEIVTLFLNMPNIYEESREGVILIGIR